jgi:hypothetical protein
MTKLPSTSLTVGLLAAAVLTHSVSAQNVGIGTTTPKSKLSVNGTTASGGIAVGDATYTSTTGTVAPLNGAIIQGFTGIGTKSPGWLLTAVNDQSTAGNTSAVISLRQYGSTHNSAFEFFSANGTEAAPTNLAAGERTGGVFFNGRVNGTVTGLSAVSSNYRGNGTTNLSDLEFGVSGASRMFLASNGKLGIDTANPLGNLHVVGDFNTMVASGNNPRLNLIDTTLGTADVAPAWLIDNSADAFRISRQDDIFTPGLTHFRINNNGTVGIGLPGLESSGAPILATLHVGGPKPTLLASGSRSYFAGGTALLSDSITNVNQSPSILTEAAILTKGFFIALNGTVTTSDVRFKNVIGVSDSMKDLGLLNDIQVTDYTYIDKQASGGRVHKKLIAQQIEGVLPSAINKRTDFVPDIFTKAAKVEAKEKGSAFITMEKAHPLKPGDTVRLFDCEDHALDAKVTATDGLSFSVATTTDLSNGVFVYGTEQRDVRAVDYEAIAMLNVSATQELSKRLNAKDAEIAALKAEVSNLKAANAKLGSISAEMDELKQAVAALRSKGEGSKIPELQTVSTK